jgi:hypothetical protein
MVRKTLGRIGAKERQLSELERVSALKGSMIINDIAGTIPESILLSEIAYNPLKKRIEPEKPIDTEDKVIIVSGTTTDNLTFTDWTRRVSRLIHVRQLVITFFGKNDDGQIGFSIKLILS